MIRVDLHCHTQFSSLATFNPILARAKVPESFSDPDEVYLTAKARGMDLVTFTDHDTVNGCSAFMEAHPQVQDFFMSEEVTARVPSSNEYFHINVFAITRQIHEEIQTLRNNVFSLIEYLQAKRIVHCVNHLFSPASRSLSPRLVKGAVRLFAVFETRNGTVSRPQNDLAHALACRESKGGIGGSDAHSLRGVGRTYTCAPGARDLATLLESIRLGYSWPEGSHGGTRGFAREAAELYWQGLRHCARAAILGRREIKHLVGAAFGVAFFAPVLALAVPFGHVYRRLSQARAFRVQKKFLDQGQGAGCAYEVPFSNLQFGGVATAYPFEPERE